MDSNMAIENTYMFFFIPPANYVCVFVGGGHTVFTMSVRLYVRVSVRDVLVLFIIEN